MCCDGSSECMCALTNSCALVVNGSVNQRAVLNMGHHEINTSTIHIIIDNQESQRTSRLQGVFQICCCVFELIRRKAKSNSKIHSPKQKTFARLAVEYPGYGLHHGTPTPESIEVSGSGIHNPPLGFQSWIMESRSLKPINERVFDVFDVHCSTYLTCDRGRTMQGGFEENDV